MLALSSLHRTFIHVLIAHVSRESSPVAVAAETPLAHSAVGLAAAKTLRPLTDFVVRRTDQQDIGTRAGAQVLAGGAVLARRAGTGVDGGLAARTGETLLTAAVI